MKKLLALVFFLSLLSMSYAQISSFPYNEDFEGESAASASCGGTYNMQTPGWANTGTQTDWFADVNGTTSSNTGPSGPGGTTTGGTDHNPGTTTGIYLYLETSGSCSNQTGILESPVFDFTSAAAPQLDFWYHMFGATMGTLFFEASNNGGATWSTLWSQTGDQGNQWLQATINIAAYGGQPNVKFRFRGLTGTSFTSDMAIDDISIVNIQPDNAGVSAVLNPTTGAAAGLQNVDVTLTNFGNNLLNTVNVEWEVNGVAQTTYNFTGPALAALGGNANITLGSYNFPIGTTTIKAWTSQPNGVADTDNGNDTIFTSFCTGISGTFTVGTPTSDYTSIDQAVQAIYNCGISGPTVFQVASGLYNTFVNFNGPIPGASATNTVTFNGAGPATTIIEHDGTGTNGNAVVSMDGASFITFQNFTLRNTGTTDAWGVLLTNAANYNTIRNNVIELAYSSGIVDVVGVLASASYTDDFPEGDNANNCVIEGNTIVGGEQGIHFEGAFATRNVGNKIIGNTIYNADDYGIYVDDQDFMDINDNYIYNLQNTIADGIYCLDLVDFNIMGNRVVSPDYGIYVSDGNFDATASIQSKVVNNMISAEGTYGFYLDDFQNADIMHNTVWNRSQSTTSAALYINDQAVVNVLNNIFVSDNGYVFRNIDPTAFDIMDNNLFHRFNTGVNYISFGTVAYANLAAWQNNTYGHGQNSVEGDPVFFAPDDLHVDGVLANDAGNNAAGITVDIDGEARPFTGSTIVDIGADEYKPKDNDAGVVALVNPQPPLSFGFQPVIVTVRNFGVQDLTSFSVEWTYNGTQMSTIGYTGSVLAPAQTVDVTLGSINFQAGQAADFVFWTDMPNGVQDERIENDTLRVSLCPGLAGTYTVGDVNADYPTIADAISTLYECGVAGPVVFELVPGTYMGSQINLTEEIPGASVLNTVTFDGVDPSLVLLSHDGSGGDNATVLLDAVDHVRIQNLSIETTAASGADAWGVFLTNQADNNQILNNEISATFITGVFDVIPVVISNSIVNDFAEGNNANYTLIEGNLITGGEMGIHIEGSAANRNKYNRIINNTIVDFDDYGIYMDDQDSVEINRNTIYTTVGSNFSDGIYSFDLMDFVIEGNNINALDWGIYISDGNFDGFVNRRGLIANNMVVALDDALYLDDFQYTDIWHNTLVGNGTSSSNGLYVNDPFDLDVRNNIFMASSATSYGFETPDNPSMVDMDHNVYYKPSGTNHIRFNAVAYTLANWQAGNFFGYDANSLDVSPMFVGFPNDLHIMNVNLNTAGDTVGVAFDYDMEVRPSAGTIFPDIGADELLIAADDAFPVALAAPAQGACESSVQVLDVIIGNNGLNTLTAANVTVNLSGIATGTYTGSYSGSIPSGGQDTVFNIGTVNTTGGGVLCVEMITQMVSDGNISNDTTNYCLTIASIVPNLQNDTTCVNTTASITANPAGGIAWYSLAAGGSPISTADTLITPVLFFTTTYYAEVTACGTTRYPVEVVVEFPTPFDLGADTTICESSPLTLSAPAGNNYVWSTGETTSSIQAAAAGTYSVTVIESSGCQPNSDIVITNFAGPGMVAGLDTLVCGNDQAGTIDLSLTGGSTPFTYLWSDGSTLEDPSGLNVGEYTVTVTDANGCEFYNTFPVLGPDPILIAASISAVNCVNANTGAINLAVSGGAGGYTYLWDNAATTQNLNNITVGDYTVTVTDASGCSTSQTINVEDTPPVQITVNNVVNESVDFGGSIDISYTGGVAPLYVVWNTGDTTEDLTNLVSGTYIVTIYDAVGCAYSDTIVVEYTQPTFVEEISNLSHLKVFPNPTKDWVTIELSLQEAADVQIDLFNLLGQHLQTLPVSSGLDQSYQLNMSAYAGGMYMARIRIDNELITTRIILEK